MATIRLEFENGKIVSLFDEDITSYYKDMRLGIYDPDGNKIVDLGRDAVAQGIIPGEVYYNHAYATPDLLKYMDIDVFATGFDRRILKVSFKVLR